MQLIKKIKNKTTYTSVYVYITNEYNKTVYCTVLND